MGVKVTAFRLIAVVVTAAFGFALTVCPVVAEESTVPQIDPSLLPYHFVIEAGSNNQQFVGLDSSGRSLLASIQSKWDERSGLSAVVFGRYPNAGAQTLRHVNLTTDKIISWRPINYDQRGLPELAVTYITNDTMMLEILWPDTVRNEARVLGVGKDRNGNNMWEGSVTLGRLIDVPGTSLGCFLIAMFGGYDYEPRKLICYDPVGDSSVWEFRVAGHVDVDCIGIVDNTPDGRRRYLVSASSPANGYQVDGMDDFHSYGFCLNDSGEIEWQVTSDAAFSSTRLHAVDVNDDGSVEVLVGLPREETDSIPTAHMELRTLSGDLIWRRAISDILLEATQDDYNDDGSTEILLSIRGAGLCEYRPDFTFRRTVPLGPDVRFFSCEDFLGNGKRQLLYNVDGVGTYLLSRDLEVLAFLPRGCVVSLFPDDKGRTNFNAIVDGKQYDYYRVEPTAWYTIFFRRPILAFLAGAVPLSLLVAIIWIVAYQFRRRNRLIQRQRDELDRTLETLRRTQRQLVEAEKYAQAKDIAGGVAHEIRNALAPASHTLELLVTRIGGEQSKNAELLSLCQQAVERGLRLTDAVNRYTTMDGDVPEQAVSVKSAIAGVLDMYQVRIREMKITTDIVLEDAEPVTANPNHVHTLFDNIIINALDALRSVENGKLTIGMNQSETGLAVTIGDNGPGIPVDERERVFDLFYSTKPRTGSGIGLALVRKIADVYGVQVSVLSPDEGGTTFKIVWPQRPGEDSPQ